jgi:hypothetical protein
MGVKRMESFVEVRPDGGPNRRSRRAPPRRPGAEQRPQFLRSEARRATDMASRLAATRAPRQVMEDGQEQLMTFGLRASITAAMVGMSLFFHAQLGAALASLLP